MGGFMRNKIYKISRAACCKQELQPFVVTYFLIVVISAPRGDEQSFDDVLQRLHEQFLAPCQDVVGPSLRMGSDHDAGR